jgi:hypothetical protein
MPALVPYLERIDIRSARSAFEKKYPDNPVQWKVLFFFVFTSIRSSQHSPSVLPTCLRRCLRLSVWFLLEIRMLKCGQSQLHRGEKRGVDICMYFQEVFECHFVESVQIHSTS